MPDYTTRLRPAVSDIKEGRLFARYLDRAAEGFFRFWLGRRVTDIIATAFIQPGHDLSYQHTTFAEREGAVVGMFSGYTAEQHRLASDRPFKLAAGKYNIRMLAIAALFTPLMRVLETIADGDFYVQAIAVDKGIGGRGVGSVLMDEAEARAADSGSARISLDVSAKNKRAYNFYRHRGMRVEAQWPKRIPLPGLKLLRMTKTL